LHISYHKKDSFHLGRSMEYKRYGHSGRPVVVFPTSGGRFFQYEDSGAVGALAEFIDDGRIQIFTLDGIDGETFLGKAAILRPASAGMTPIFATCSTRRCPTSHARRGC
jgi:esterase/lipase superfamily enzyme